jgi:hypothetical protein
VGHIVPLFESLGQAYQTQTHVRAALKKYDNFLLRSLFILKFILETYQFSAISQLDNTAAGQIEQAIEPHAACGPPV